MNASVSTSSNWFNIDIILLKVTVFNTDIRKGQARMSSFPHLALTKTNLCHIFPMSVCRVRVKARLLKASHCDIWKQHNKAPTKTTPWPFSGLWLFSWFLSYSFSSVNSLITLSTVRIWLCWVKHCKAWSRTWSVNWKLDKETDSGSSDGLQFEKMALYSKINVS